MYKIQWRSGVLSRRTSNILGLRYATQVIMERRHYGGGKGKGEGEGKGKQRCLNVLRMHGEVEEVGCGCSASRWDRALVPGDVNAHGDGLSAREANG